MHTFINRFLAAGSRDPKRIAVLGALCLLLVALWVRHRSRLPVAAQATGHAIEEMASNADGLPATPDISRAAGLVTSWRQLAVAHPPRNPFASELTMPPTEASPAKTQPSQTNAAEEDGLFWRQLAGALASRADREQYRRALGEDAVRDTTGLLLSSVVLGPDSRALIGDKLVRVGDLVAGGERGPLTVVAIEQKRVVLARDGHHIVLVLGRQGGQLAQAQ